MQKVFNDSIHGHMQFHPLCVNIIDTPEFQRLRNIKQLGLVYYVYPTACNNRFEHSLGVCHLARLMIEALVRNSNGEVEVSDEEKLCVEIAALCHDLGHGPFSHTWERFLKSIGRSYHHENGSWEILRYMLTQNNLKASFNKYGIDNPESLQLISELILGAGDSLPEHKKFLYQIVNNKENGIDVDKWDYILRDGKMCNLSVQFNYERLLAYCKVFTTKEGKVTIAYPPKAVSTIFDLFIARIELHLKAYQHKVVKNLELMLIDALQEVKDVLTYDGLAGIIRSSIPIMVAHENVYAFVKMTDHILTEIQNNEGNPLMLPARQILHRMLSRNLYCLIGIYDLKELYINGLLASCYDLEDVDGIEEQVQSALKNQFPETFRVTSIFVTVKHGGLIDLAGVVFYNNSERNAPPYLQKENMAECSSYGQLLRSHEKMELLVFVTDDSYLVQAYKNEIHEFILHILKKGSICENNNNEPATKKSKVI